MSNKKVFLSILGGVFLLGVLLIILFAALFPKKFADGAKDVLFLDEREEAIFRRGTKNKGQAEQTDSAPVDPTLPASR